MKYLIDALIVLTPPAMAWAWVELDTWLADR